MATNQKDNMAANGVLKKRRQYIVDPAFQWRHALLLIVAVFTVSSFMSMVLFGVLYDQARARFLEPAAMHAGQSTAVILGAGVAFAAVTALALGIWSIVVTHRVCGPLFVLQRWFGELTNGRFPKRRPLRRKDEFKELFSSFWGAVDALRSDREVTLASLDEAASLARSATAGDEEHRQRCLDTLTAQLDSLRKDLAQPLDESTEKERDCGPPSCSDGAVGARDFAEAHA